jgi:hypothetical protein
VNLPKVAKPEATDAAVRDKYFFKQRLWRVFSLFILWFCAVATHESLLSAPEMTKIDNSPIHSKTSKRVASERTE